MLSLHLIASKSKVMHTAPPTYGIFFLSVTLAGAMKKEYKMETS